MVRRRVGIALAGMLALGLAGWLLLSRGPEVDDADPGSRPASSVAAPDRGFSRELPEDAPFQQATEPGASRPLDAPHAVNVAQLADPAGLRVTGRTLDAAGAPLAGADVLLAHSDHPASLAHAARTTSAADGRFVLVLAGDDASVLFGQNGWLVAEHGGTDSYAGTLGTLGPGELDVGDIVLARGAGLRGRVLSPDGTPLPGAAVGVQVFSHPLRQLATGPDGRFAFAGLPPGEARLSLEADAAREVALTALTLQLGRVLDVGDVLLDQGLCLEGIVLDASGKPCTQAYVRAERVIPPAPERDGTIERTGRAMGQQWVDEAGHFLLPGLAEGEFELLAWAHGQSVSVTMVQAGERQLVVQLAAPANFVLELRDLRTEAPVEKAELSFGVNLVFRNRTTLGLGNTLAVVHGAEAQLPAGSWSVAGSFERSVTVFVQAEGYSPTSVEAPILPPGGSFVQRLRLQPTLHVRGLVVDPAGEPVAEATVQLAPTAGPCVGMGTRMVTTDAIGRFELAGAGRGTWRIWAYHRTECPRHTAGDLEITDQDLDGVVLRLLPGATITGSALTTQGLAVKDARVGAWCVRMLPVPDRPVPRATVVFDAEPASPRAETRADASGAFTLANLPPGEYLVAAALPWDEWFSERLRKLAETPATGAPDAEGVLRIRVDSGDERHVNLPLPHPASVHGTITVGGKPAPAARVAAVSGSGSAWTIVRAVDVAAGGAYELDDLPPFEGAVIATVPGEVGLRFGKVSLQAGDEAAVDLDFGGPGVSGRVLESVSRRAAPEVLVHVGLVQAANPAADPSVVFGQALGVLAQTAQLRSTGVRADESGRFRVPHLTAGTWQARAEDPRWFAENTVTFEVKADWTPDDIELLVKSGAVVEGRARWALGGPAGDEVEVGLYSPVENTVFRWANAKAGAYRLEGLRAGVYELRVRHMAVGGVVIHTEPVTLREGEQRTLDLTLKD